MKTAIISERLSCVLMLLALSEEAEKVADKHVKLKAATDILTGIQKWENKVLSAKRRWVFEAIQNSLDAAKARGKKEVKIILNVNKNSLIIQHNSGLFSMEEIVALIYGGSSKPFEQNSEYLGRFGTGFLVTHIISKIVIVDGYLINSTKKVFHFNLRLDRSHSSKEEMAYSIELAMKALDKAVPLEPQEEYWTTYTYGLNGESDDIISSGLSMLESTMPALFSFNNVLKTIELNGKTFAPTIDIAGRIQTCSVSGSNKQMLMLEDPEKEVEIGMFLQDELPVSIVGQPIIYVGLPLTDTSDYISLPFVINSNRFQPTEERSSLIYSKDNHQLLESALKNYYQFLQDFVRQHDPNKCNPNLAQFELIPDEECSQNQLWEKFNESLQKIFELISVNTPLVLSKNGLLPVASALFPSYEIADSVMDSESAELFSNLISQIKTNIPSGSYDQDWITFAKKSKALLKEKIQTYGVQNLRTDLKNSVTKENKYQDFKDLQKAFSISDIKEFMLTFFNLCDRLFQQGKINKDFVEELIPDQKLAFGPLSGTYGVPPVKFDLSIESTLNPLGEAFKDICYEIGLDVRNELVAIDFSNFAIVKANVSKSAELSSIQNKLTSSSFIPAERPKDLSEQKNRGWIKLFWWYLNNHIDLPDGFPVLTKENERRILDGSKGVQVLVPFDCIGIPEEYERLFPSNRIMNSAYIETVAGQLAIQRVFSSIPAIGLSPLVYQKEISFSYLKLRSLQRVKEVNLLKDTHRVQCEEPGISTIPFLGEIEGRIGESRDLGKLFLKFSVYIAEMDPHWNNIKKVDCLCKEGATHSIYPSYWLSALKSDQWVPFRKLDEKASKPDEYVIDRRLASKESIENLYEDEKEGMEQLLRASSTTVAKLLPQIGFDLLDLKVKLFSLDSGGDEAAIRENAANVVEVIRLVDPQILKDVIDKNPEILKDAFDQATRKIEEDNQREINKVVGKNTERIIAALLQQLGAEVNPIYKGGDLELWPDSSEGFDAGAIEISSFIAEVKFTTSARAHLSKLQGKTAAELSERYIVIVIPGLTTIKKGIEERLESIDLESEVANFVKKNARIITNIHKKLAIESADEEVEPDIKGFWVKKKAWEAGSSIDKWVETNLRI